MLIKSDKENNKNIKDFILFWIIKIKNKSQLLRLLFFVSLFILIIQIPFDFGLSKKNLHKLQLVANNVERPIRIINPIVGVLIKENILFSSSLLGIFKRYLKAFNKEINVIYLDIKLDEFEKIKKKRNEALKTGFLTKEIDDEVKASISYGDNKYPVEIRLKGDFTDHLLGNKWSYRVKTKRGTAFNGLTEFSFQHPRTRSYLNEYIFHLFLKENNLPHLRYDFFKLILNGKNLGTYALEEHFTKELIEYNRLRESPILNFSCDLKYRKQERYQSIDGLKNSQPFVDVTSEIDVFNKKKVLKNLNQGSQFILAKDLLMSFLSKDVSSSDIFDMETTTKFFAIVDLLSANHSYLPCNLRFYFNPILSRFSLIGFDADSGIRPAKRSLSIDDNPLNIFNDLAFSKGYVSQLELLSSDKYLDNILKELEPSINSSLNKLNKTFPHVKYLKNEIQRTKNYINNRLSPINPIGINYLNNKFDSNTVNLVLYNRNIFPININNIILNGELYEPEKETILLGMKNKKGVYEKVTFKKYNSKNKFENYDLPSNELIEVNYNLYGSKKIRKILVNPKVWFDATNKNNAYIIKAPNHRDFKFIKLNEKEKVLEIDSGSWILDKPLILPKNYKLLIKEGTTININSSSYILSQGPLEFNGKKDSPILFKGIGNGRGLIVSNSQKESFLNYVKFESITNPEEISLNITGSVTFYNSPVSINNSYFYGTKSEDALNLFRSNFIIKNTHFKNVYSDALDLDFSDGYIENVFFENVGNDGLDLSGSIVEVYNLSFLNIKDKSISVGEKSKLKANNIKIDNSFIGIASKDNSFVEVKNLSAKNLDFCLAAYNKKPEYGEGNIKLENEKDTSICFLNYLLEKGSFISINSKKLSINAKDISKIIYEN